MRQWALVLLALACTGCTAPMPPVTPTAGAPSSAEASADMGPTAAAAAATVSLHIYSGLPDPMWTLDGAQVDALSALIESLAAGAPVQAPSNLGYRGFSVEVAGGARVTAAGGTVGRTVGDAPEWFADPERTVERWLLASGEGVLRPAEVEIVKGDLEPVLDPVEEGPADRPMGFALTLAKVAPADAQALGDLAAVPLEAKPLLVGADFTSYDVTDHTFTLTPEAEARLIAINLPTSGRAFVVSVDQERIYAGAFWTPLSSLSYDGVTILLLEGFGPIANDGVYRIELGYPGSSFFNGPDPRSDPRILAAVSP